MAKVLKVVGIIAGGIALFATGVGAVIGTGTFLGMSAGTWTAIGAIAGVVAGVAGIGAQLLTKPPPARGSVTQLTISPDAPAPYVMGEGYFAGVLRYQRSYGPTLDKVPNPYRFQAVVYSAAGPVQSISPRVDFAAVSGYYSGFLFTDVQTGACPESNALAPQWPGAPGWTGTSKLSGKAAIGWSLKFDKNGKVFASGMPPTGAYLQGVKVYDPRLDSTFPGGSGACRVDDEATFVYSECPALQAGTYALGRYQNGKRVMGIGLPADAIDWANVAAWANVCDANAWTMYGVVAEPGDRWANLRDICVAGGAEPVLAAGSLYFHYAAPRVSVATIGAEHLMHDQERSVVAQASWRDRLNTIIPKGISPDHNWQTVQDAAVQVSTYLAEDGELKQAEWPFNFVKDPDQRAQLARYKLEDSRELQAIELPCIYSLAGLRPGDAVDLDLLDELGLAGQAVIVTRDFDPAAMAVKLTLVTETAAKHAYALGQTGTPPPTPALGQTAEERDAVAVETIGGATGAHTFLSKYPTYPLTSTDTTISVAAFTGALDDGRLLSLPAATITGLSADTAYTVFRDIGGETYLAVPSPATTEMANSGLAVIDTQATAVSGGGSYTPPADPPPGRYEIDYR